MIADSNSISSLNSVSEATLLTCNQIQTCHVSSNIVSFTFGIVLGIHT